MPINALSVLCAQLTRDLLAIAKFLFVVFTHPLCSLVESLVTCSENFGL